MTHFHPNSSNNPSDNPSDHSSNNSSVSRVTVQEKEPPHLQPPPAETSLKRPRPKIPKPVRIVGAIALLAGLGFGVYRLFFYQPQPDGLFLSGRIEGYETDVSAQVGGRVETVEVREGETVQPGDLLVELDEAELQARLQGAIARVEASQDRLTQAQQQLPILQAQLQQAQLQTQQATEESQGRVVEARNQLAVAQAELEATQERLKLAQAEQQRYSQLYAEGAASAQRLDEENQQLGVAQAEVRAAQQRVAAAQGQLTQAQSAQQNPPIRAAAELELRRQIEQAQTEVNIAQKEIRDAQAEQARIEANLDDLTIESPTQGIVMTRLVEPGEVVAAGAPLLTIVDSDDLYLRGYVPEGEIGRVTVGQSALVYLDSFPDRPLQATVSRIDPQASFTPENTYFREDRVNQVFGVELTLANPQGFAKQGMPADGRILLPEELSEDR